MIGMEWVLVIYADVFELVYNIFLMSPFENSNDAAPPAFSERPAFSPLVEVQNP